MSSQQLVMYNETLSPGVCLVACFFCQEGNVLLAIRLLSSERPAQLLILVVQRLFNVTGVNRSILPWQSLTRASLSPFNRSQPIHLSLVNNESHLLTLINGDKGCQSLTPTDTNGQYKFHHSALMDSVSHTYCTLMDRDGHTPSTPNDGKYKSHHPPTWT